MGFRLQAAPATEPVTSTEAKAHLHIEHSLDDTYITTLIAAARKWAEKYCWRGICTQTWELRLAEFPADDEFIRLGKGNAVSVTHVKYVDVNGVEQTMSSGDYTLDTDFEPGLIRLNYDAEWPDARAQWDAVRIRFVVGWAQESVPEPIKQAVLLLVAQMYEQRVPEVTGTIVSKVQFAVEALLEPYRLRRF